MKKKFSMLLLVACLTVSLTGCGTKDDVKVISKDSPTKEADSSAEQEKSSNQKEETDNTNNDSKENPDETSSQKDTSSPKETEKANISAQPNLTGYIFETQGTSGMISIGVDMDGCFGYSKSGRS